jgi:hypothetical protein
MARRGTRDAGGPSGHGVGTCADTREAAPLTALPQIIVPGRRVPAILHVHLSTPVREAAGYHGIVSVVATAPTTRVSKSFPIA